MFIGEFAHTIDSKDRIILPAKFRKILDKDKVILAKGFEKCLFLYSLPEWNNLIKKLKNLSVFKKDAQKIKRTFISSAYEFQLDTQGRFLIPSHLKKYAELEKEVSVIGVDERIEIWNMTIWQKYSKEAEENYAELADQLINME
ncbi:MAG: division/cell wall cluster transcriptional repressor MraZ [bacterium]